MEYDDNGNRKMQSGEDTREYSREWGRQRRAKRIEQGLCTACGKRPLIKGRGGMCDVCADANVKRQRERKAARKAGKTSVCPVCGAEFPYIKRKNMWCPACRVDRDVIKLRCCCFLTVIEPADGVKTYDQRKKRPQMKTVEFQKFMVAAARLVQQAIREGWRCPITGDLLDSISKISFAHKTPRMRMGIDKSTIDDLILTSQRGNAMMAEMTLEELDQAVKYRYENHIAPKEAMSNPHQQPKQLMLVK